MKKLGIYIGTGLLLAIGYLVLISDVKGLKHSLDISIANEKAAIAENDSLKNKSIAYQYTIDQLEYTNDSIVDKLNKARKELKVKDSKLKELAYLASVAQRTDTIFVKDTIFKDKDFALDTTIGDEWYKCNLGLKYPNIISVSPEFKSEKSIIVSSRRETISPAKKCWLARLFQKKHTLLEVNVVEENPYIETTQSKFIKVLE